MNFRVVMTREGELECEFDGGEIVVVKADSGKWLQCSECNARAYFPSDAPGIVFNIDDAVIVEYAGKDLPC